MTFSLIKYLSYITRTLLYCKGKMDIDLNQIFNSHMHNYPDGNATFENELCGVKRALGLDDGYHCDICNKVIKHRANFKRHVDSHNKTTKCFLCDRKFNRLDSLKRHERGHLIGYKKNSITFIVVNTVECIAIITHHYLNIYKQHTEMQFHSGVGVQSNPPPKVH